MSTSQTPSPSPEIVAGNDDLLTEILSHVPVKPLLRFKSVNKQWNSVISHHRFSLLHCYRHLYPPSSALFVLHHSQILSPSYDFISFTSQQQCRPPFFSLLNSPPFHILQSCNGLFLCSSGVLIFVCNPTSNQKVCIDLPIAGIDEGDCDSSFLGFNLGFDPARSPHYQVVSVSGSKIEENSYSIDVYSSGNRKWRRGVIDPFKGPFDVEFDHGVYWEGRVYWLSHTETTICFDFDTECVESLAMPKAIEGAYIERFRYFGESCGHLHLIEIRTNCVSEFNVLELDRKSKAEWFVKYRVNLDVLGRGFEAELFQDHSDRFGRGLRFYAFSILAVVRDNVGDGDDDSALVISIPGKVITYNFRTKVSKLLCNVVDESDKLFPFRGYNAFQFIESIYCV
ncbi:F-box protein At5g07610-like [Chenopodium quinoa]|uniref:F-box protein At5g07610-like n=1 Tax=Chenopodium quinoa TaxID=63459 RepID=UPI000B7939B0|nr:F-box protein At5g07610-like [Chenopodium quinoa]